MKYNLGIDLGGTSIKVGVVDSNYKIIGRSSRLTLSPRQPEAIADDMAAASLAAIDDAGLKLADIETVGIGSPGVIDPSKGRIIYSNNLQFEDVAICSLISERLGGKPTLILNDANAAALGELKAGAGRNVESFVAVTLGTGIGTGVILNSKLYYGFNSSGGELGHIVIEHNGKPCTCGRRGCFEAYSSASGLIGMTREYMEADPKTIMWELTGGNLDAISTHTAFEGMRAGDETAKKVIDEYIDYLGTGILNIVNALAPEIICIGGGIGNQSEILIPPLSRRLKTESFGRNCEILTQIVPAELGNDAGIIGAASLGDF